MIVFIVIQPERLKNPKKIVKTLRIRINRKINLQSRAICSDKLCKFYVNINEIFSSKHNQIFIFQNISLY